MKKLAIHSVPRSGSTWLGAIIDSHPNIYYKYQPLFSYAFKDFLDENSNSLQIEDFFTKLSGSEDSFLNQIDEKNKGLIPSFTKGELKAVAYKEVRYHHIVKNMLLNSKELKVIGLVRNPLAVLFSWWNAPKEFRKDFGWKFKDEWQFANQKNEGKKENFYGYENWKLVALLFEDLRKEFISQFKLVNYSELIKNPIGVTKELMSFIDVEIHPSQIKFVENPNNIESENAYSVYKERRMHDQEWSGKLPDSIVDYIKGDLKGTVLEKYLE